MSHDATIAQLRAAASLRATTLDRPAHVAFVACSYDTDFEPVEDQVRGRIGQVSEMFGLSGPVTWSLWIVDDLPPEHCFSNAVRNAYSEYGELRAAGRLQLLKMVQAPPRLGGLKGRALLDGMAAALGAETPPDAIVYLNLNLKVDAVFSAPGVALVLEGSCDAAIGSRAKADGGTVIGAGRLGRLKSRIYSRMARTALPLLRDFEDTNAPVKVFSQEAAQALVHKAEIEQVTMDCEWLMIMMVQDFKVRRFPVAWIQRAGSRPPWHLIPLSIRDLSRIRSRWRSGALAMD